MATRRKYLRFQIHGRWRAIMTTTLCWSIAAILIWAMVNGKTLTFDQAGLLLWRNADLSPLGPPRNLEMVRDITALGGVLLRNVIAAVAFIMLLYLKLRREAWALAFIVSLGWIANSLLKALFARPRPDIVPHLMEVSGNSFPSGHSFNAAAVYVSMALIFAAINQRFALRAALIGGALLLSLTIAWSRVWLGVHWPTDVMVGWLLGVGWAFCTSALCISPRN